MLQVSDAYKELVKSNIRPKCEPIIKVSGIDNTGKEIELVWNAKNIKDLKYKRGIDPVGRELPYMELTWTEIYTGKLNAENYPEKYNNIMKYMTVELSFVQDLSFYNTWKTIFKSGKNWKDLFSKTWKQVRNQAPQEIFTMPKMFLSARPTISGQTITWVARDFLWFAENAVLKDCNPVAISIPFLNPIMQTISEIAYGLNIPTIKNMLLLTNQNLEDFQNYNNPILEKRVIANLTLKNFLLNYINILNLKPYEFEEFFYLDFKEDGSCYIAFFANYNTMFDFRKNIMFQTPKITNITNISSYEFKRYLVDLDINSNYQKSYSKVEIYDNDGNPLIYRFDFDGCGAALQEYNPNHNYLPYELTYALSDNPEDITVTPIKLSPHIHNKTTGLIGEIFTEDNTLNPYDDTHERMVRRFNFLKNYFNENSSVVEFECLPVNHIEVGDGVYVETSLYSSNNEQIFKGGLIVSQELTYNGAFRQKNILHEYPIPKG